MRTPDWDLELLRHINGDWRFPLLDAVMPLLSEPLMLVPVLVLALGHLYGKDHRLCDRRLFTNLAFCALAALTANLLAQAVKYLAGRGRPLYSLSDIWYYDAADLWRETPDNYIPEQTELAVSFFSAHASTTMALATALGLCFAPLRAWVWLIPALCGYSRVYMGMHYPSDVLVGWAAGAIVAWGLWRVRQRRRL